jgi:hypothetical protein
MLCSLPLLLLQALKAAQAHNKQIKADVTRLQKVCAGMQEQLTEQRESSNQVSLDEAALVWCNCCSLWSWLCYICADVSCMGCGGSAMHQHVGPIDMGGWPGELLASALLWCEVSLLLHSCSHHLRVSCFTQIVCSCC